MMVWWPRGGGGGNPEQMGSREDRGRQGGEGTPRVAMSWKSSRGWRWAKVYVDTGVSQVSRRLHAGLIDRPSVLPVPAIRRKTFSQPAPAVWSPCIRCGVQCLADVCSRVRGRPLPGGSIVGIQTHGRHGWYQPHWHLIATRGGWAPQASPWHPRDDVPYRLLRKQWQWPLLTRLRQTVQTYAMARLGEACYPRYREGFVTNVHKGDGPSRSQSVATSLAK
jgi:hypothetical protein